MRTRVRMWWVVKWGGSIGTALLMALWIASMRWAPSWEYGKNNQWYVANGRLRVQLLEGIPPVANPEFAWCVIPLGHDGGLSAGFEYSSRSFRDPGSPTGGTRQVDIAVPLWVGWLPLGLASVISWRRDRRARRVQLNQCVRCGYDRAGLTEGAACPECGGKA